MRRLLPFACALALVLTIARPALADEYAQDCRVVEKAGSAKGVKICASLVHTPGTNTWKGKAEVMHANGYQDPYHVDFRAWFYSWDDTRGTCEFNLLNNCHFENYPQDTGSSPWDGHTVSVTTQFYGPNEHWCKIWASNQVTSIIWNPSGDQTLNISQNSNNRYLTQDCDPGP